MPDHSYVKEECMQSDRPKESCINERSASGSHHKLSSIAVFYEYVVML